MAKIKTIFVCQECGCHSPKWAGRCPECSAWNTFIEQVQQAENKSQKTAVLRNLTQAPAVTKLSDIGTDDEIRYQTDLSELDRVLGGGIVSGSVVLLSGDPGIGKSTLLLQISEPLSKNLKILYISGEESARQIKLRADRLGVTSQNLYLVACTDIEYIIETIGSTAPDIVIVDSIQTMNFAAIASSSGSVSQVRECTQLLIHTAKNLEIPIFIVGHVNKDGAIAGPKVLEHMVDAVLYIEGDRHHSYRILRAVKNRYGSTNEIGVFEMGDNGLNQVENPSLALLAGRPNNVSGTCVACVMEGSRPILVEVQALVSKTGFATPLRTSTGFDYNRTALLIAVLEKRGGYFFGNLDTYINVVGGLKLDEPAADLPIAMALVSNLTDKNIPQDVIVFGEIGLAGEVRAVSNAQARISEAYRLGFRKCILPTSMMEQINSSKIANMKLLPVETVADAFKIMMQW